MIKPVIKLLRAHNAYSEPLLKELKRRIVFKKFAPQELVLREGDICRYIYLIVKGGLRAYMLKGDKEITTWGMLENDLAAAADSFFLQIPSREYIEACEQTEVISLSHEDYCLLCDAFPAFQKMVVKLLGEYYAKFYQRAVDLVVLTKEERYQELVEKQPELARRLPLTQIKSYLGMSQASLSRIREKDKDKG
ncbi:MAG TPA: Crp/Fnr family transcriptional regulator [Chitinophaga sp.]